MYQLAAFRAIQGIGAGGLMSLALAIIGDIVPPRERARYQGYFLAVFGTSSVLGPVIGGFFAGAGRSSRHHRLALDLPHQRADRASPAFVVVCRVLHLPHTRRDHRIDWPGALALIVGLVPLLIVAEQGRDLGLGLRPRAALLRHRRRRPGRVHPGRAGLQGRRAAPAAAVPQPHASRSAASAASSSARACSAASCCCRCTCRSCTGSSPTRGRPADDPAGRSAS